MYLSPLESLCNRLGEVLLAMVDVATEAEGVDMTETGADMEDGRCR